MFSAQTVASLLLVASAATAEMFYVNNLFTDGDLPYVQNEDGIRFFHRSMMAATSRFLQDEDEVATDPGNGNLDTGNRPDINSTNDVCQTTAFDVRCGVNTRVSAADGTYADLDMTITCDLDSQTAFDFRRARSCSCSVAVVDDQGVPKACSCAICPDGFGNNPLAIECVDDFVIATCSSLDCDFSCNGTCSFDCANSGPECTICEDNPNAPTVAPTGVDGSVGEPSIFTPSGGERMMQTLTWQAVGAVVLGMTLYGLV
jgi:hypothetical protein